jgi:vancomycin resistance protein VanJ
MKDGSRSEAKPIKKKKLSFALKWLSIAYPILLALALVLMRWVGERHWITATAIFLPPTIVLLPLCVLTPLCYYCNRRWIWWHGLVLLMLFSFYFHPHFASASSPVSKKIRIVTNNVGQRKPSSVTPFINAQDPDIVAFQEARNRDTFLRKEYPNRYVSVHDEFALVSKWPIKALGYVPGIYSHYGYAGTWFELEFEGKPLIIYNIHMPTPRPDFVKMRGKGFLASLVRGEGVYASSVRAEFKESMDRRVAEVKKLSELLRKETRPYLVVGDFNMPDTGYLHRFFTSTLNDAFATKGSGYGLTFPGFTRNPLSLFGPWLRIDYIFSGEHWRVLNCEVEGRQNAQHLAIVADLEWVEKP